VIATATHDTASAVAAMPLDGGTAFLSSGTWSLLGLEVQQPVINDQAREANLTNEGGVGGSIRLLRNVMGLWLLQQARAALGSPAYAELVAQAEAAAPFTAFIDPDDARLLRIAPAELTQFVSDYCEQTHQSPPTDAGTLVRVLLESLALQYAAVVRTLGAITGQKIESLYAVGGGVQNQLLCQLTANATGLPLVAGPTEATAIGNLLVQAIALGELSSVAEARALAKNSFASRTYAPHDQHDWSVAREKFDALLAPASLA
jgi:sugar (pentulose or hexulose) kinase